MYEPLAVIFDNQQRILAKLQTNETLSVFQFADNIREASSITFMCKVPGELARTHSIVSRIYEKNEHTGRWRCNSDVDEDLYISPTTSEDDIEVDSQASTPEFSPRSGIF